ncbi:hypothetical protein BASA82_001022 [Batrachochytrium salamandrivorans]|nr:hypothetical protein BASA82_001022 [Batrachochytrium salamandrivorans]
MPRKSNDGDTRPSSAGSDCDQESSGQQGGSISKQGQARLLSFHKEALSDIYATTGIATPDLSTNDGLVIMARGLGYERMVSAIVQIHTDPHTLMLLLNVSAGEYQRLRQTVCDAAVELGVLAGTTDGRIRPDMLYSINNETTAAKRAELYLAGGVFCITSQILVLDILNKVLPVQLVTGIVVANAHCVRDISTEAFILRLYRDENKVGFIRAFSDNPEAFVGGFATLERTMKVMYLRSVYLWPRFHVMVKESLDQDDTVRLVELRVPMTRQMKEIQVAVLDCLHECLLEVKRLNPSLESTEFKLENALFKSFDVTIRIQLDPIWHRVSSKTKQLVGDLRVLRQLLTYLASYDAVTFYSFLETIMAANAAATTSIYKHGATESPWLLLDAAHTVFSAGKGRVYRSVASGSTPHPHGIDRVPPNIEPVLEEQPKWRAVVDVLKEILGEREAEGSKGNVLVMVAGDRACRQVQVIVDHMEPAASAMNKKAMSGSSGRRMGSMPVFSSAGSEMLMHRFLGKYFQWKGSMSRVAQSLKEDTSSGSSVLPFATGVSESRSLSRSSRHSVSDSLLSSHSGFSQFNGGHNAPASKRRRVRGASAVASSSGRSKRPLDFTSADSTPAMGDESEIIAQFLQDAEYGLDRVEGEAIQLDPLYASEDQKDPARQFVYVHAYAATSVVAPTASASAGVSSNDGELKWNLDDSDLLERVKPQWIIMYDPDVAFVRRIEVYKALHPEISLSVYFLVYDNSVEEQRYLTSIRREKQAFEKLINQKATMVIPIDQDGRVATDPEELFWRNVDTRQGGGLRRGPLEPSQIIVDVREFRSPLPSLIHAKHIELKPCTLEVGDYILSPRICVERKSISDLISSLKNGRLYNQCEAMCLHYELPMLLIEFEQNRFFSLLTSSEVLSNEISAGDLTSRISLLCLTFPKLGIIWSSSASATAEIFADLKSKEEEPIVADAVRVGVESTAVIDSAYNITPSDVLVSLPGLSTKNYRSVMSKVHNLRELTEMPCSLMQDILGPEDGKKLFEFVNSNSNKRGKRTI